MKQARLVRVLLANSRTLFYNDRGEQRGIDADAVRGFEQWLNRKYRRSLGARPITVAMIPTPRDRLLQDLVAGRGDLAVANLTITPERSQRVDFSAPALSGVNEIVVTGPGAPRLEALDDLGGKELHVRRTSSYYASLLALNERFAERGRPAMRLRLVPDALEDEDLMEMLDATLIGIIVVDDWKARLWAQLLAGITPRPDLVLRAGADIGWAFRKDSMQLEEEVNAYLASRVHEGKLTEWTLLETRKRLERLENNTDTAEWRKFEQTLGLFRKYGERYRIDPVLLAAQAYRESRLDHGARSRAGAIGIMQVLPSTGRHMKVGDIRQLEPNIHAGTKYLRSLIDRFYATPGLEGEDPTLFAMAAYNAGPSRMGGLRVQAQKQGLDPNVWFNNVEVAVGHRIGREPVLYVRDIFKYYAAYKLQIEARAEIEAARDKLEERR
jgi:membrane-bound lytic murein transglycosylase MltF